MAVAATSLTKPLLSRVLLSTMSFLVIVSMFPDYPVVCPVLALSSYLKTMEAIAQMIKSSQLLQHFKPGTQGILFPHRLGVSETARRAYEHYRSHHNMEKVTASDVTTFVRLKYIITFSNQSVTQLV